MKVIILCWALAIVLGFVALARYDVQAGKQQTAPAKNPVRVGEASLYVFIHPECPCSTATLGELERIQAETSGKLQITVDVVIPHDMPEWTNTPDVLRAKSNPGWKVIMDRDGRLAASMSAQTSGFCVLFDGAGKKVFQGGITASRGHEGDNAGHDSIVDFVDRGRLQIDHTPVYGCSLGALGAWKS